MENRLTIRIIILLLLFALGLICGTCFILYSNELNYMLLTISFIVVLVCAKMLVRIHIHHIEKMKYIISAIANKDYMFSFVETNKKRDVNSYLNMIKIMLENVRKEVEEKERYYQYILDNISSGIIVANENNSILRVNRSMRDILAVDNLQHIYNLSLYYPGLTEVFENSKPLIPTIFSFSTEKEQLKINILLTLWERDGRTLKIFTINNISNELEYKEMESWSRLTRVLTHEIMNFLTPIITISSSLCTAKNIVDKDIAEGLNIISTTSSLLVKFVDSYRKLSRISAPIMKPIYVSSLISSAVGLFDTLNKNILFEISISENNLMIFADKNQILQIIINLIKNGIESIGSEECGKITISSYSEENEDVVIKISDSGVHIPEEIANNMFIPFFTTKDSGSGIGLSISRQIIRQHNGSISLLQTKQEKSFILKFR